MRLAILGDPASPGVRQLAAAAVQLKVDATVVNWTRTLGRVALPGGPAWALGGTDLAGFDAVLVRDLPPGGLEQVVLRMDVLQRLHAAGVRCLNPPKAIEAAVDKYLTTALLAAAGLPVPPTVCCDGFDDACRAFDDLGGDVVVKPIFGSEGRGMVRVELPELARRVFRAVLAAGGVLYLQRHIPHPQGDHRVMVLGGRVLAGVRRWSADDFRTNAAAGGQAEAWTPPPAWAALAIAAAAAVGADWAGVDLVAGEDGGPLVLEVNAVPGFQALEQATGFPVAANVIRHLLKG